MAKYRLTEDGVFDNETRQNIPISESNKDYRKYFKWISKGNLPDPLPPQSVLPDTEKLQRSDEQMIRVIDWLVQYLIDGNVVKKNDMPPPLASLFDTRKALIDAIANAAPAPNPPVV